MPKEIKKAQTRVNSVQQNCMRRHTVLQDITGASMRVSFFLCRREAYKDMAKYEYWVTDEGLTLIEGWARDGLTDEQIAANIGVRRETIYDWKKRFPNFSNALKKGKEVIDRQVENALLRSALGYEYEEDGMTKDGAVVPLRKTAHPNTTALIFWLKNRKPEQWRDKQELSHEGNMGVTIIDSLGTGEFGED